MKDKIEDRIKTLTAEQQELQSAHSAIVKRNSLMNEEFQKQVIKNQTRYAQLSGAITELKTLITPTQGNNHDNLPTTPDLDNRLAHVRAGGQSEDR